jgi:hypothetical protein
VTAPDHRVTVEFEVNLAVTDILALQAFTLYPAGCLGPIVLKFNTSSSGLVFAQCSPDRVLREKCEMGDIDAAKIKINESMCRQVSALIKHSFTQVGGAPSYITVGYGDELTTTATGTDVPRIGAVELMCQDMTIVALRSTTFGFYVVQSSQLAITNFFMTPRVMPSQQLVKATFSTPPNSSGVNASTSACLNNVSCLTFVFPKHPNDCTVFENIMYKDLQATINGTNYPDQTVTTHGARFFQQQLVASELDGCIEPIREYQDSLCQDLNNFDNKDYPRYGAAGRIGPG